MRTKVVGLDAWCDYVTEDEFRKTFADPRVTAEQVEQVEQAVKEFRRGLHFRVEEFATLSDGRRLVLTDDRGWGSSGPRGVGRDGLWAYETVETIESTVRNGVLPDDAEETGAEHPWTWLAERIRALGVETTPEELKQLPYDVLSDRLRTWLTRGG